MGQLFQFKSVSSVGNQPGAEPDQGKEPNKALSAIGDQIGEAAKGAGDQAEKMVTGKDAAPEPAKGFEDLKTEEPSRVASQQVTKMLEGAGKMLGGATSVIAGPQAGGGGVPDLAGATAEKGAGKDKTALGLDIPGLGQMMNVVMGIAKATEPQQMSQAPSLGGRGRGAEVGAAFAQLAGMGIDHTPTRSKDIPKVPGLELGGLEQGQALSLAA